MSTNFLMIIIALLMGTMARVSMMRVDYRQYPTYPQAYLSHFTLGIIAAALGAVAIPAIASKEYVAVTFLALAAQHFRDVRNLERQSLDNIEITELVPRGTAYIEDIAKAFEARNYIAILTALATSTGIYLGDYFHLSIILQGFIGVIVGYSTLFLLIRMLRGKAIEDIAEVKEATIAFDGPLLTLAGVPVINIGLKASREIYLNNGKAVEIIPKDSYGRAILANLGQRQALQHNAATQLGIRRDIDEPDFSPIARINPETGSIVMALIPIDSDIEDFITVVRRTPILESSKKKPIK
ncbi:hypothetical protein F8153_01070 [Alkaliphilus serpentinus]|uniref:YIEGIA protein n=2 Tax=Alkaliphilus serpentinus TaxID=1482731 RepID=A0A833MBI3_9FIRM|nr:hypothetical protein F8153_01070 [Alkaliphilus serpentinus]